MKTVRKSPSQDDKVSWWYWFEKLDGNRAKCKNCDWLRDRGPAKSTSILRCHLKSKHNELYDQRMEAQATTPNPEQRGRKRRVTVMPTANGGDEEKWAGRVQKRPRRRQQNANDKAKATLSVIKSAYDGDDDELRRYNGIDHLSPKFAAVPTIVDDFDTNQMPNSNVTPCDGIGDLNQSLKQSLDFSQAMLNMFMNTLGDDPNNNGAINDNQFDNPSNEMPMPSSSWSNKRRQQSSFKETNLVDRFLPTTSMTAAASSAAASSNLVMNRNDNNVLPTSMNALSMFVPQANAQQQQPIVKMCRIEKFSAAHRLHNDNLTDYLNQEVFGKCNNRNGHGHNYTWKVVLRGPVDQNTGMVYNLADLKREMNEVLEQVDHKHLDKDVPYFRENGIVSTTENLSVFLYNELFTKMSCPELLHKVVVSETDKNSFSFAGLSS